MANFRVKMAKMPKIDVFSTSYNHENDFRQKFEYHFGNSREISYKIRPKIFFHEIVFKIEIRVTKKKSNFCDFPYIFL